MQIRPYQERAISNVEQAWSQGAKSVLLVSPTGSGKTYLGQRLVGQRRTLWVAPRRELVDQAASRLRLVFGAGNVGVVMPGASPTPRARIQVGTIQTLIGRPAIPADLLVLDEAHHFLAATWGELVARYPSTIRLGLTATPERDDGTALGDMFEELVVVAQHSELIALGFLVPSRVYRPAKCLGSDIAMDPLDAWARYSEGAQTFAFEPRTALASELATRFRSRGIPAEMIQAETATQARAHWIAQFRAGQLSVLTNVNVLTEGIDIPEARVALLGRYFKFGGALTQAVGRVMRPSAGKTDCVVIDLCGSSCTHGLPDQDRKYSLSGRAIVAVGKRANQDRDVDERPVFSRDVVGLELEMVTRGALPSDAVPPPPLDLGWRRSAERTRAIAHRAARKHGRSIGESINRLEASMSGNAATLK